MHTTTLKNLMAAHNIRNTQFVTMEGMVDSGHAHFDIVEILNTPITVEIGIQKIDFHAIALARRLGLTHSIKMLKLRIRTSPLVTLRRK